MVITNTARVCATFHRKWLVVFTFDNNNAGPKYQRYEINEVFPVTFCTDAVGT